MIDKKLFTFEIEEHNGGQEYSHTEYVWANTLKQAEKLAQKYCKNFYEGGMKLEENHWHCEVDYSDIDWYLHGIKEVTEISIYPINTGRMYFDISNGREDL